MLDVYRDITRAIRGFHAALVERGITPQEDEPRPVILKHGGNTSDQQVRFRR